MQHTAVQRFYRFHAYIYDFTRWTILHGRKQAIEKMQLEPNSCVLEVGCGTGLNFRHILSHLDAEHGTLWAVDFSAEMLKRAQKRVESNKWTHVKLLQADATKLSLGRKFDAIVFAYSLTMIPDWRKAVEVGYEHLLPGGRLVVLDFGRFQNWGPFGAMMRGWLKLNHVDTQQPYCETIEDVFGNIETHNWLGGYNFTAIGRRH